MTDQPKHRGTPKGPRHAAQEPDDPARIDLDELFPGTKSTLPQRQKHKAPRKPRKGRTATAAAMAATGTIAVVYGITANPNTGTLEAVPTASRDHSDAVQREVPTGPVDIVMESPKVGTEAAPPPPPPEPEPAPVAAPASPAPVAVAAPAPQPVQVEQAPPPPPATDAGAAKRDAIVRSALAQVGWSQDCVAMVARAIKEGAGISWYKWPVEYYQIGYPVSAAEALPGDLIYYVDGNGASIGGLAHIAVYIGDGMAVHGGWDGWTTIVYSANVGSGPNYIRIT